jgi:homoserine O-acetyltransferase/O-succinyltransferase
MPSLSARPSDSRPLHSVSLAALPLDSGTVLRDARMAYHLDGTIAPARDNVVLVLHALTGSADAAADWWRGVIGDGLALDTQRWAVLAPNLLGSCYGSTGPSALASAPFPALTVRDIARAVALLLDRFRIARVALASGGSLGGMVALELAASFPGRVARSVVFAAPARLGAATVAWSHLQRHALDIGGSEGLRLAREIAMLSYRAATGLEARFARRPSTDGQFPFAVQAWLNAHGERLQARFDAQAYRCLIDAMDTHDLGGGRGGIGERLRASGTQFTGVGIQGDIFCPADSVREWVTLAGGTYRELESLDGHDAFLTERAQVAAILAAALGERTRCSTVETTPAAEVA